MNDNTIKTRVQAFGKRLLDTARDEYYASPESRIHTIVGGASEYFVRLRKVKAEWDKNNTPERQEFQAYLKENYGIQMKMEPDGIDIAYEILDEKKHTLFLLKFGG
jgi:hypothetical protein